MASSVNLDKFTLFAQDGSRRPVQKCLLGDSPIPSFHHAIGGGYAFILNANSFSVKTKKNGAEHPKVSHPFTFIYPVLSVFLSLPVSVLHQETSQHSSVLSIIPAWNFSFHNTQKKAFSSQPSVRNIPRLIP